jgi:deoxyribonuclease V
MIAYVDVYYRDSDASAAGVTFLDWSDAKAVDERVVHVSDIQPYEAGQFFRRELPCLLAVLKTIPSVNTVVIDGYVWLDGASTPGLGAHLHRALGGQVAVVGVAKTRFQGTDRVREVIRGVSKRPLFVTAAGMEIDIAARHVLSMHGDHRIPTLLKRVDYLCRHKGVAYLSPNACTAAAASLPAKIARKSWRNADHCQRIDAETRARERG